MAKKEQQVESTASLSSLKSQCITFTAEGKVLKDKEITQSSDPHP